MNLLSKDSDTPQICEYIFLAVTSYPLDLIIFLHRKELISICHSMPQAITWNNDDFLSVASSGTNFEWNLKRNKNFFLKMCLNSKMMAILFNVHTVSQYSNSMV